jgi:hypothetical protein
VADHDRSGSERSGSSKAGTESPKAGGAELERKGIGLCDACRSNCRRQAGSVVVWWRTVVVWWRGSGARWSCARHDAEPEGGRGHLFCASDASSACQVSRLPGFPAAWLENHGPIAAPHKAWMNFERKNKARMKYALELENTNLTICCCKWWGIRTRDAPIRGGA